MEKDKKIAILLSYIPLFVILIWAITTIKIKDFNMSRGEIIIFFLICSALFISTSSCIMNMITSFVEREKKKFVNKRAVKIEKVKAAIYLSLMCSIGLADETSILSWILIEIAIVAYEYIVVNNYIIKGDFKNGKRKNR